MSFAELAPTDPRANSHSLGRAEHANPKLMYAMIKRNSAFVWRSLVRYGVPRQLADDATQLVFLTLSNRFNDVCQQNERAFLSGTCLRVAANLKRSVARRREVTLEGIEFMHPTEDPERLLQFKQGRETLALLLSRVPSPQRVVFVRHELEGQSLVEIAKSLGIPLGTATSRLRRARARFEAMMALGADGDSAIRTP